MREDIAQYEFENKFDIEDQSLNYQLNGAVIAHTDPDKVGLSKSVIKQSLLRDYNYQLQSDQM